MNKLLTSILLMGLWIGVAHATLVIYSGKLKVQGPTGTSVYNGTWNVYAIRNGDTNTFRLWIFLKEPKNAYYFSGYIGPWKGGDGKNELEYIEINPELTVNVGGDNLTFDIDVIGGGKMSDMKTGVDEPATLYVLKSAKIRGICFIEEDSNRGYAHPSGAIKVDKKLTTFCNTDAEINGNLSAAVDFFGNFFEGEGYTVFNWE